jgi:hypothetical protein
MGSAWVINLAVAEWVIRRPRRSGSSSRIDRSDARAVVSGVPW